MSRSEPPPRTHSRTAAISSSVKAEGFGRDQSLPALRSCRALEMTSTPARLRDSLVKGALEASTR
jgi:hypothetical protein